MNFMTGTDTEQSIHQNTCVLCQSEATLFKDALSKKEFAISGMCQTCQDKVFF